MSWPEWGAVLVLVVTFWLGRWSGYRDGQRSVLRRQMQKWLSFMQRWKGG
jgi:hypothetical protein